MVSKRLSAPVNKRGGLRLALLGLLGGVRMDGCSGSAPWPKLRSPPEAGDEERRSVA